MRKTLFSSFLLFLVATASCQAVEFGKASFYGGRWIGRKTANGEYYKAGDFTAAHKRLPFNTFVKVTNLANNKDVVVRINNRGPFVKGRVIDLSVKAAQAIDMVRAGVSRVKIEIISGRHMTTQNKPSEMK